MNLLSILHNKKQAQLNVVLSGSMKTAGENASDAFKEDFKGLFCWCGI